MAYSNLRYPEYLNVSSTFSPYISEVSSRDDRRTKLASSQSPVMSETIRPWVKRYILEHAQTRNTSLEPVKEAKKICQIIRVRPVAWDRNSLAHASQFRTFQVDDDPCGPPGGIWADISDGAHHVPVHLTRETVNAFVQCVSAALASMRARVNSSRRSRKQAEALTTFKGGIFRVKPRAFICQLLPKDPTSLESIPRIALRLDVLEYVGSAGEPTFKDPKPVIEDAAVAMWVHAVRGDVDAET